MKTAWIGITVGMFVVGIGIGYAVFQASSQSVMTTSTETELEKYQIAEQLATQHIKQELVIQD